jgi:uroporphyrinogen III methyltransferase / synthase
MTVYLVGAGPGDPGLLTVRGRDLLAEADVVLYDGLVDRRILALVAPGARLIDVGKVHPRDDKGRDGRDGRDGRAHNRLAPASPMSQEVVEALLVEHGRTGACVVRLKGGDPFIFGRGGEEALALVAAGIPFEVVPGVSSAIAAPAYAGIPVTHRGLAASVTIVTGHEAPGKPPRAAHVDWDRLATATDTLVILMGVGHLAEIALRLQAAGRPAATPAAIVEQGTTSHQRPATSGSSPAPLATWLAWQRPPACGRRP